MLQAPKTTYTLGIDIGSTTVKIAILRSEDRGMVFSAYERHHANIQQTLSGLLRRAEDTLGEIEISPVITGSGGLTSTFRPILAGLKDRFNLTACVIDPYYGQNAVTAGVEEVFGKGFSQAMTLLLIAGSIDLSLGYQLSLINVFCAFMMVKQGMPMVPAILLSLLLGVAIGFVNGVIITCDGGWTTF